MIITKIFILATLTLPAWAEMRVRSYLRRAPGIYDKQSLTSIKEASERALNGPEPECLDEVMLENGATLSAALTSPPDGGTFLDSANVLIAGTAEIGMGGRHTHWTYVIDKSDSTDDPCDDANPDGDRDGDSILDCELIAIAGVHQAIEDSGSAVDYGLTTFDDEASSTIFASSSAIVTTDRDTSGGDQHEGDMQDALADVSAGGSSGGTEFYHALQKAKDSVDASAVTDGSKKFIIFLSDGHSEQSDKDEFLALISTLNNAGVTIFAFAVGTGAKCGADGDVTLESMAFRTGGTCEPVMIVADLDDVLLELVFTKMTEDSLAIDGTTVATGAAPMDGPVTDNLSFNALGPHSVGDYEACIFATGLGPANDPTTKETAGCCVDYHAVSFDATPATETNELGESQKHTVTAKVFAGLGGGQIKGWPVMFTVVSGPNEGTSGDCSPTDCKTDASGIVTFTYSVPFDPSSLGTDVIEAEVTINEHQDAVEVRKIWEDTTPPEALCREGPNPSGKPPKAPGKGGKGQNQDGFYTLEAEDELWSEANVEVFIRDDGSGHIFGPYNPGTNIKYTEANGASPSEKLGSGVVLYKLKGKGDAMMYAVDGSGNQSPEVSCLVPPNPK